MEGKLFLISLWCGVYSLCLRKVRRSPQDTALWVPVLFNGGFWATAGILLGMLVSSYRDQVGFTLSSGLLWAVGGLLAGAAIGYGKGRHPETREALLKDNLEWSDTGFSAILLASFVMFFVVQAFKIPSGSMRMTFVEGDHLFVNKFIYGIRVPLTDKKLFPFRKVQNGDIVIFRFPSKDRQSPHYGKDFIKRVVGTAGQTVLLINKKLFVDGKEVVEPYKQNVDPNSYVDYYSADPGKFQQMWDTGGFTNAGSEIRDNFGPVVVPPGTVLVLGDNRDRSYDSRFWGPLPLTAIKGRAWVRYWGPLDPAQLKEKPWLRFWLPARIRLVR